MKYNYYDSNKIVIHGKAVPGQTLAWGETKMLTADKIQSVNTTDYWGNVLYAPRSSALQVQWQGVGPRAWSAPLRLWRKNV